MEEKGTETNRNDSVVNLMAIDELYYKIKTQQKMSRCKSANVQDNTRKNSIKNRNSNKNSLINNKPILNKEKNKSIELPLFTPKNSVILNKKTHTINLTNLFKTNDSKRIESTKQSTRRVRVFSGHSSSNYSLLNKTKKLENTKKSLPKKKSLSVVNINVDVNRIKNNDINNKNKTLKDLTIQKLIQKAKMIDFNKIMNNNNKNRENIKKAKIYDLMPLLLFYTKQKENNIEKIKKENNSFPPNNKNKFNIYKKANYPVKYRFFDNAINNIQHIVNFVDIENREEIKQNVIKDYDENFKKMEDFKSFGYEIDPERIEKIYQDEKHKYIKKRYKELKKQILDENIKNVAFKKMMSPKKTRNYIPEYKRLTNELLFKKRNTKSKSNMLDKETSTKEINKDDDNNDATINEYQSNTAKKSVSPINNNVKNTNNNEDKTATPNGDDNDIQKKTLLNINKVTNNNTSQVNNSNNKGNKEDKPNQENKDDKDIKKNDDIELNGKKKNKKIKKKLKDYNKIVSIVKIDNFFLKATIENKNKNKTGTNITSYKYIQKIEKENSKTNNIMVETINKNSKSLSRDIKNTNKNIKKPRNITTNIITKKKHFLLEIFLSI